MRKMKLDYWKAMDQEGKEMQESLIEVFSALLRNQNPQNMPKGFDKFRIFSKLIKSFDKAKISKILELEDTEYVFLKKLIESDVPAIWAMNTNILTNVETFMDLKVEG